MTLEKKKKAMAHWDITPVKSANQGIKYLHAYQLPWNNYLDSSSWLSPAAPGHPGTNPGLLFCPWSAWYGTEAWNWWQRKASFWTILFCCNKTYLPPTFLKQKPVKICFQKNPATIIDNNKNWLEKCFVIHPNLQSLGVFFHPAMETA